MSAKQMRALRKHLQLSQYDFGKLLGLTGKEPDRPIRAMEHNERDVTGPIKSLMRYMDQPFWLDYTNYVPKFFIEKSQLDHVHVVIHAHFPRFLAMLTDHKILTMGVPDIHFEETGKTLYVTQWIDDAMDDQCDDALETCETWMKGVIK